jgi:hypothetical protein
VLAITPLVLLEAALAVLVASSVLSIAIPSTAVLSPAPSNAARTFFGAHRGMAIRDDS